MIEVGNLIRILTLFNMFFIIEDDGNLDVNSRGYLDYYITIARCDE
jgi:hypothetical protein